MQITSSLTSFARASVPTRTADRRGDDASGNARTNPVSQAGDNPQAAQNSIQRARRSIVEQTVQGEVIRPETDEARLLDIDPFARVVQRVSDFTSRRDVTQTALNAYTSIQAQSERDSLVETLGIDVFA